MPMIYDPIVICLYCTPAVYGQYVGDKWKVRSLPGAYSYVDLLKGVSICVTSQYMTLRTIFTVYIINTACDNTSS